MKRMVCVFALVATACAWATMEPATPESQGVPSDALLAWLDACEATFDAGKEGALHGFVLVRHGKVIAEGSWKPFDTLNETHMLYSHSKSFTSSAVGFLVDEGKVDLDERIVDIFTNECPEVVSQNLAQMRVRDLLTMNAGGKKDHLYRGGGDWAGIFFRQDFPGAPGLRFRYDSDATYMLAALAEKRAGMPMMDWLRVKMFDKIGIRKAWTTSSPQGIPCGGWGMNMTTREMARFGQLYLQKGVWDGERLLSSDWVALATTRQTWCNGITIQSQTIGSGSDWNQGYGFQFWRCRNGAFRADGAYGQFTVVMPDQDAVLSIHAGVRNMQKELNLVWEHLLPAMREVPLAEDASAQARLSDRLAKLQIRPLVSTCSFPVAWQRKFAFKDNPRGLKSVEFEGVRSTCRQICGRMAEDRPMVRCRLVTRAGEQTFLAGDGAWVKGGGIRIDTEDFEALGAYVGEHAVAASCGVEDGPTFRLRAYLTGDTGHLDFAVRDGRLTGEFWAMKGCELEGE